MQALVWHGPGAVSLDELAEPRPAAGEVVLATLAVGVCGSEVEAYRGLSTNRVPPIVMGHEVCATVLAAAGDLDGPPVGARVVVNPLLTCGTCLACRRGDRHRCPERRLVGLHTAGGFAERFCVPAASCHRVPTELDARSGAFVEPLANGAHAARLALSGDIEGPVVVLGAGALGAAALQALRCRGASDVRLVEADAVREREARRWGPRGSYLAVEECGRALIAAGTPAAATIDAVGAPATRAAAVDLLGRGGRAVLVGLQGDCSTLSFARVVREELTVLGCYAYSDADFATALGWTRDGVAGPGRVEPVRPYAGGPATFADLAAGASAPLRTFLGPTVGGSAP